MLYGIYPYPAHIQDTLYILTVEMECQGWCAGDAGVVGFCDLLETHSIYGAKRRIWKSVILRESSDKNN
jgi:hypothetical protein